MSVFSNLVECKIKRVDALTIKAAPTIFHLGKIQYCFAPRPELTGDEETSVCIVVSQEHRDYLLTDPANRNLYCGYEPRGKASANFDAIEQEEFKAWKEWKNHNSNAQGIESDAVRKSAESATPEGMKTPITAGVKHMLSANPRNKQTPPEYGKSGTGNDLSSILSDL